MTNIIRFTSTTVASADYNRYHELRFVKDDIELAMIANEYIKEDGTISSRNCSCKMSTTRSGQVINLFSMWIWDSSFSEEKWERFDTIQESEPWINCIHSTFKIWAGGTICAVVPADLFDGVEWQQFKLELVTKL